MRAVRARPPTNLPPGFLPPFGCAVGADGACAASGEVIDTEADVTPSQMEVDARMKRCSNEHALSDRRVVFFELFEQSLVRLL